MKFYASKGDRKWALKNLEVDEEVALSGREAAVAEEDYEMFMQVIKISSQQVYDALRRKYCLFLFISYNNLIPPLLTCISF